MSIFSETGHICCQNNVAKTNGKTKKIFKKKKKPFEGIGESPRQKVACAQRDNLWGVKYSRLI